MSAPLPAQAMRAQVASGYTVQLVTPFLVISPVSLSSNSNFLCIAAGWVVVDKKCSHHRCETVLREASTAERRSEKERSTGVLYISWVQLETRLYLAVCLSPPLLLT